MRQIGSERGAGVKRVGLIGFGDIGSYVFRRIEEEQDSMEVGLVYRGDRGVVEGLDPSLVSTSVDDARERGIDLMVEVANDQVLKELAPDIIQHSDLLVLSLTGLADDEFRARLDQAASKSGRIVFVAHGAIVGLDGIYDGRDLIDEVEITTTKSPKSFGHANESITHPEILYEGPTREACLRWPRNVNVHAAVALAGLGFDKTRSRIVADPGTENMGHVIVVKGKGLSWRIGVESPSLGGVTGAYTPESVYQTVRRICTQGGGIRLA